MRDIVEELRDPAECTHAAHGNCTARACMEYVKPSPQGPWWRFRGCLRYRAAAEIERLRASARQGTGDV